MISKFQYVVSEIARKGDDPGWWRQRFLSRVAGPMVGVMHRNFGENFMEKDWDNLLLLDACRADMFQESIDLNQFEDYDRIHSLGCSSPEFMKKTFEGREFPDTVYVTGNPWISKIAPDSFHDIINLWVDQYDIKEEDLEGAIDLSHVEGVDVNESPTIYAEDLTKAAVEANKRYPNKRLIIHYFQPHAPVVGLPDGSLRDKVDDELHPGDEFKKRGVTREEVWEAYKDNLKYAFTHANKCAKEIGGKSVFSADHGELFGERIWPFPLRAYQHPSGLRHPKLTEVPWATKTIGERREITEGELRNRNVDDDEVDEKLRHLGYKI